MKNARLAFACLLTLGLAACETPTAQRYAISADNNRTIKTLDASPTFGEFAEPASYNRICRGLGPVQLADGLTPAQYIRKAFSDEFQMAAVAGKPSDALLTGRVTKLEFSSTTGVTGGVWEIYITLTSSTGKSMVSSAVYRFNSGFIATEACRNVAEAFPRAVQDLIANTVSNPSFRGLLK